MELGLTAAAVSGEVYNTALHKVTTCLEHPLFSKLIQSPEFMRHVLYLVVDEAHCISQWGDSFRKKFGELCEMRSFEVGTRKAFFSRLRHYLLTSIHAQGGFMKVEFSESTTYIVNLGNDRDNITPIVHRLKAARSSLPILDFLVRPRNVRLAGKLPPVIIFFQSRDLTHTAYRYKLVPSSKLNKIRSTFPMQSLSNSSASSLCSVRAILGRNKAPAVRDASDPVYNKRRPWELIAFNNGRVISTENLSSQSE